MSIQQALEPFSEAKKWNKQIGPTFVVMNNLLSWNEQSTTRPGCIQFLCSWICHRKKTTRDKRKLEKQVASIRHHGILRHWDNPVLFRHYNKFTCPSIRLLKYLGVRSGRQITNFSISRLIRHSYDTISFNWPFL